MYLIGYAREGPTRAGTGESSQERSVINRQRRCPGDEPPRSNRSTNPAKTARRSAADGPKRARYLYNKLSWQSRGNPARAKPEAKGPDRLDVISTCERPNKFTKGRPYARSVTRSNWFNSKPVEMRGRKAKGTKAYVFLRGKRRNAAAKSARLPELRSASQTMGNHGTQS